MRKAAGEFEIPLIELEEEINQLRSMQMTADDDERLLKLQRKLDKKRSEVLSRLNPWQSVEMARHPEVKMPIYEFRCKVCGRTSEHLIGMHSNEVAACEHCGSIEVERIMSVAAISKGKTHRVVRETCCGREERCETPPCSGTGSCSRW